MKDEVLETGFNGLTSAQPALPAGWYHEADHHAREMRDIWGKSWVYLARGASLEGPGAFRVFQVAGQEVLVVRDREGVLRGFFNTCRHRGSALCLEAGGRLETGRITCPYHQWTYGLDGRLIATGAMRPVAGFERAEHGLLPVALAEWGGFLFANLAGADARPFDEAVAGEFDGIANWPLENLVTGHTYRRELACNWKIFWENFNECLHCPNLHPELCELVPIYGRAIMARRDDPDWAAVANDPDPRLAGGLRAGGETWSMDGRAQGTLTGLGEADLATGQCYGVALPSLFIACHRDYVRAVRIMPLGPERMELSAEWLFDARMLARPDFDLAKITDFGTLVMEQDGAACEMNQRGLRAQGFERGVLMQEEYEVFLFQDWVRGALGEARKMPSRAASRASRRAKQDRG